MGYRSDVNIRIPLIPEIEDQELYPIFQQVFNALHMLNSALNSAGTFKTPGINDKLSDSFGFSDRVFWARCAGDVTKGKIVRPADDTWRLGARALDLLKPNGTSRKIAAPFGLTLSDQQEGKILIGYPPAIIESPGIDADLIGKRVYTDNSGVLAFPVEVKNEDVPVGLVVESDYILLTYGSIE